MTINDRLTHARERYRQMDTPQFQVIKDGPIEDLGDPNTKPTARRGLWMVAGAAVVALVVVGAVSLFTHEEFSPVHSEDVIVGSDSNRHDASQEKTDDPEPLGHRATWSPDITLHPDGPYRDRDEVVLEVPSNVVEDLANNPLRQCAVVDAGTAGPDEWCDPTIRSNGDTFESTDDTHSVAINVQRVVFTPFGDMDCEDPAVTCRLVVRDQHGRDIASAVLRFIGAPGESLTSVLTMAGESPGEIAIMPTQLVVHPSWLEHRESHPQSVAGFDAFWTKVCAFDTPLVPSGLHGQDLWGASTLAGPLPLFPNCQSYDSFVDIDPDDPNVTVTATLPRWFLGYHGWSDCRAHHCYLVIERSIIHGINEATGLLGGQEPAGVALLAPELFDEAEERPNIEILSPPPHNPGSMIEIEVTGLPADYFTNIGVCDVENPWRCGYIGASMGRIGNGRHHIDIPAMTICPTDCYLELDSQGEGMPPLATAQFYPEP